MGAVHAQVCPPYAAIPQFFKQFFSYILQKLHLLMISCNKLHVLSIRAFFCALMVDCFGAVRRPPASLSLPLLPLHLPVCVPSLSVCSLTVSPSSPLIVKSMWPEYRLANHYSTSRVQCLGRMSILSPFLLSQPPPHTHFNLPVFARLPSNSWHNCALQWGIYAYTNNGHEILPLASMCTFDGWLSFLFVWLMVFQVCMMQLCKSAPHQIVRSKVVWDGDERDSCWMHI